MSRKRIVVSLGILCLLGAFSMAQIIPTGKLIGKVTEPDGQALPGASVSLKGPALILPEMVFVTNEQGQYRFSAIPSGTYTVTATMPGMKTLIREGIIIKAGGTVTLDMILEQSPVDEKVVVYGQAPIVDMQTTTTGNTFTKEFLESLPRPFTGQSEYMSAFHMAPGVYERHSLGSDERSYKFMVDGVMIQHPVTGGPILELGYDAIGEIMVTTAAHDASEGAVKGAIMQALTRTGGNEFGGEVNFFLRDKSLQGDNTAGTPFEGRFIGFKHLYSPSFSLGGPIKKDKLWFFGNMSFQDEKSYAQGYPALSTTSIPVDRRNYTPFFKLTWQIGPNDRLMASGYWQGYYRHHRGANLLITEDATGVEDRGGTLATVQYSKTFSPNFLMDFKGGLWNFHQNILAKNEGSLYLEYATGIVSGNQGYDYLGSASRIQFNQEGTLFVDGWQGNHELKFGLDLDLSRSKDGYLGFQDPIFEGWFDEGYKAIEVDTQDGVPQWAWVYQGTIRKDDLLRTGIFAQDTWSPARSLVVNFGLRYDYAKGSVPPQVNSSSGEVAVTNRITAMTFSALSPRLGLTFDPFGNGKTVFKAHVGRYYAPMLMTFYWLANPNQEHYFFSRLNPDWTEAYRTGFYDPSTTQIDSDIKNPYSDEITFGFEREIIQDLSFSATFIATWEKNLIEDVDMNHVDVNLLKSSGELSWIGYNAVQGTDPTTGNAVTFYEYDPASGGFVNYIMNIPGTLRKYRGLQLMLNKRVSRKWGMQASYIWGRGEGLLSTHWNDSHGASGYFNNPNAHVNAYGLLDNQRQHHAKLQLIYQAPLGIFLTGYYEYGSGSPWTRVIRTIEAGLGSLYQGVVAVNAEPRGTQHLPDLHTLSMRIEKDFRLGPGNLGLLADVFNVFNANTVTSMGNLTGVNFRDVFGIVGPRYFNLGLRYRF